MYISNQNKNHIVIIGAGGTGGWFAQFLSKISNHTEKDIKVTLIDGDRVETKNLIRQNFESADVDSNKATAVGSRFNFDIVDQYITSKEMLKDIATMHVGYRPVIIGAVDNNGSRKIVEEFMNDFDNDAVWIDSGNTERDGQVVFYPLNDKGEPFSEMFKTPMELYPDVFNKIDGDERRPDQISCAEQSESAPQNVVANIMAATTLFGIVNKLLNNEAILFNEVKFNSQTMGMY